MISVILFYFFLFSFWAENVLGFKLTSIHGASLMNFSFYLMLMAWCFTVVRKKRLFEFNRINGYLLLLFGVIAATIPIKFLFNEVPGITLWGELTLLKGWLNPVLLFFILYNTLDDERHCRLVLFGLFVFFAVTVVTAISASSGFLQLGTIKVAQDRSAGFAEPNQYAAYLVLFLPVMFSGALFAGTKKKKIIFGALIFLACISLLITGSRGGVLSLFFAICVYLFTFSRKRLLRPGVFILVLLFGLPVLAASTYLVAPDNVKKVVLARFDPSKAKDTNELTSGRTVLWANGFQLFLKSPIFGHGSGTFIPLMKKNFRIWGNSHNDYLLYLVQYGIIGLGLFLMVLWSLFRGSWLIARDSSDRDLTILALSYFAGLSGFAVAMFGVNVMQPLFLFWAYSAVVLRNGQLVMQEARLK